MIDVSDAFDSDTCVFVTLYPVLSGYWDADNQWVQDGLGAPIQIIATPIPSGDLGSSSFGEGLQAQKQGERTPAFMKFRSPTDIPLNSVIEYQGIKYKILRYGELRAGGYTLAVGASFPTGVSTNV